MTTIVCGSTQAVFDHYTRRWRSVDELLAECLNGTVPLDDVDAVSATFLGPNVDGIAGPDRVAVEAVQRAFSTVRVLSHIPMVVPQERQDCVY